MIEVKNLVKKYGNKTVLDHVSFEVKEGEILGFLGPNGAGKSTTMNIITGNLSATEGTASIDGFEILESPLEAKKRLGYLAGASAALSGYDDGRISEVRLSPEKVQIAPEGASAGGLPGSADRRCQKACD